MPAHALNTVLHQLDNAAGQACRPVPRLLAVSKHHCAAAIAELATAWRCIPGSMAEHVPAFGENYVQEALAKQAALAGQLAGLQMEWHLIGHLQSNKARDAARAFDWVQTVDRARLVVALAAHRPSGRPALNVLIQVNIDDEASKHGCRPDDVTALAAAIAAQQSLTLRGLMAIPAPDPDMEQRRTAFRRMKALFDQLGADHPQADTLSMGMSEDFALAIGEGATMVRIGTALFGARPHRDADT